MERIILIGARNKFSASTNKWLFVLAGILFLTLGVWMTFSPELNIAGIMFIIIGLYQIIFGLVAFSQVSRHSMKIKLADNSVEFKDAFLKSDVKFPCDKVVKIRMDELKIIFSLEDKNEILNFGGNQNIKTSIKQAIRELAELKNIPLAGE